MLVVVVGEEEEEEEEEIRQGPARARKTIPPRARWASEKTGKISRSGAPVRLLHLLTQSNRPKARPPLSRPRQIQRAEEQVVHH